MKKAKLINKIEILMLELKKLDLRERVIEIIEDVEECFLIPIIIN